MKRHIFGGICQVLFRKKWGDFNYEQRKSLEKSRLRIPRRYLIYRGDKFCFLDYTIMYIRLEEAIVCYTILPIINGIC